VFAQVKLMPDASPLHIVRLAIATQALFELGKRRRLPTRDADVDYLAHCLVSELFGDHAPKPFRVVGQQGRYTEMLGYCARSSVELSRQAQQFADPALYAACQWDRVASKTMPSKWANGTLLGFEVRACPIVRLGRKHPTHRAGAEVDAYLQHLTAAGATDAVTREAVYRKWLGSELARRDGAELLDARVDGFQLGKIMRRTKGETRRTKLSQRPDVVFRGELRVTNPSEFMELLRRGIGRHRAFGFGMLLLRPHAT
jgi:CRISPR system Cascade subunit CasE